MNIEEFKMVLMGLPTDKIQTHQQPVLNDDMLTMIGYERLTNIEVLIKDVVENNIEGEVIETGVWRGGACIFMRKLLNDLGSNKTVFVADSFKGLPKPDEKYPHDKGDYHHAIDFLSVSLNTVIGNFKKHGLLKGVVFIKGWFKNTLHKLQHKFCIIRLDGDMYESTMDALKALYSKLSYGGYCIVDDYNAVNGCKQAVMDYRDEHDINSKIIDIDGTGVYWQKLKL